jgi:hypothetical protein
MWNALRRRFRRPQAPPAAAPPAAAPPPPASPATRVASSPPGASSASASAPHGAAPPQTADAHAQALARPIVERLSDDERLRGDLTDASFGPLLAWLEQVVTIAATRAPAGPAGKAWQTQASDAARQLARAIVGAAERNDTSGLAAALSPALFGPDAARAAALPSQLSGATPDERARELTQALAAATGVGA